MIILPDDLRTLSDIRLQILFGQTLVAIKRETKANPRLKKLCEQSDAVEDEIARRDYERWKGFAP